MWFNNLYILPFEKPIDITPDTLQAELRKKRFSKCFPNQRESLGWVSPLRVDDSLMVHSIMGNTLITMCHEEKILPAKVVSEELADRVADTQAKENRVMSNHEKRDLKQIIIDELLPRAFTKKKRIDAWLTHDYAHGYLFINTSSDSQADAFTGLLRKSLGSLPVSTLSVDPDATIQLTEWLNNGVAPAPFELGTGSVLKSNESATAKYSKQDLTGDEVEASLQHGKYVAELDLVWEDKISFTLTSKLVIKKLKFLDVLEEELAEQDPQTHAEHVDIQFALMTGEVKELLADLLKVLSGK